jgi:tetratricopeptide (TPR) repeat protein
MTILICLKCNKEIDEKKSLQHQGLPYCPNCKGPLKYLGQELASLSPQEIFNKYDKSGIGKKVPVTGKRVTYENPYVNTMLLELEDVLRYKPNDIKALFSLAKICQSNNDLKKAKELLNKIIGIVPDNLAAHQNLADIYLAEADYDSALNEMEKIKILEPKNYLIYLNLGIIYYKKQNWQESLQSFLQASEFCKDNDEKARISRYIEEVKIELAQ